MIHSIELHYTDFFCFTTITPYIIKIICYAMTMIHTDVNLQYIASVFCFYLCHKGMHTAINSIYCSFFTTRKIIKTVVYYYFQEGDAVFQ